MRKTINFCYVNITQNLFIIKAQSEINIFIKYLVCTVFYLLFSKKISIIIKSDKGISAFHILVIEDENKV